MISPDAALVGLDRPLLRVAVLCVCPGSFYHEIPGLDLYDRRRDAYTYRGSDPVICHAPCAQWSQLRGLARPDVQAYRLAHLCYEVVSKNGGVFEHPSGSRVWSEFDWSGFRMYSVDQHWFGFPARKRTRLAFRDCYACEEMPLNFDLPRSKVEMMFSGGARERTPLLFDRWLVNCVRNSYRLCSRTWINGSSFNT